MAWNASDIPPLGGRTAIVTGVGGLGFETALGLVGAGCGVLLAGRDPARGREAAERIRAAVPNAAIRFETLDLASLASVQAFAGRMLAEGRPLDILVNNAGVMSLPDRRQTPDGFEWQLGVNYLGHFALTLRLLPLLKAAPAPRVVCVSSVVHRYGKIDFDDLQATDDYRPDRAYRQSKLAMLMFALEFARRAETAGSVMAGIAAHPGVARTELFVKGPGTRRVSSKIARMMLPLVGQSAADGALPLLFAATAPEARSGGYYGPTRFFEMRGAVGEATVAPQAEDAVTTRALWEASEKLTGLAAIGL